MDINEAVDLIAAFYNEKERELLKTILAQKIQIENLTAKVPGESNPLIHTE